MRDFRKYKLQIIFSGFLILISINASGQFLKKNAFSIEGNAGYDQQKINIGYSYSAGGFESPGNRHRHNQIFIGYDAGAVQYRYKYKGEITPWPYRWSKGVHFNFSINNFVTKPELFNKTKVKLKLITLKIGLNRFGEMPSKDYEDIENYTGHIFITDRKVESFDIELINSRMLKLNSNNFIKLGCYIGTRIATYNYAETTIKNSKSTTVKRKDSLAPFIFGFCLGYQFNFGQKP